MKIARQRGHVEVWRDALTARDARRMKDSMLWALRLNRDLNQGLRDQAIRTLNKSYGVSIRELAELSGLTTASVSRIANLKQRGWGDIQRQRK